VGSRDPGEAASLLAPALRSECRQRGSRHTYTRFMMGAFHDGRRCGTCCDANDTVSPMCAGADWDGAFQLRKTSLLEVEARCSRDEACEGYYAWNKPPNYTDVGDMVRPVTRWGTTGAGFRFKSGKVYGWAKLERVACSWPDLRRRGAAADAPAAVPGPEHLLAPMREWADEAWARLQQIGDLVRMRLRADQLRNFTSSRLPSAARELPVLYLFGGADLLTASWLFPSATRHTLMAALPLGQPSCFLQTACRAQAHRAVADYFKDWARNSYAWTQSEYMVNYWFTPKVGVLPALLLSLRILGERLVAMERSSSYDEITLVRESVENNAAHAPRPAAPPEALSRPCLSSARPCLRLSRSFGQSGPTRPVWPCGGPHGPRFRHRLASARASLTSPAGSRAVRRSNGSAGSTMCPSSRRPTALRRASSTARRSADGCCRTAPPSCTTRQGCYRRSSRARPGSPRTTGPCAPLATSRRSSPLIAG
jgi:hypothetical protein